MDDREGRARAAVSDLGSRAAEIGALHIQLADAGARQDRDTACGLAEDLITRHQAFAAAYRRVLCIGVSTRPPYPGLSERMSV